MGKKIRKKTIWDLDYQAIIKFAEEDHKRALKEGEKYAVLQDEYEKRVLKINQEENDNGYRKKIQSN